MASCFTFLLNQLRTSAGDIPAGYAYFYEVGTTTPKTIYLDKAKATTATNPYTLSANSQAQLYGAGYYRVVIKTAAGVTKYDWDNVFLPDYDIVDSSVDEPPDVADGDVWTTATGMFVRINGTTRQLLTT